MTLFETRPAAPAPPVPVTTSSGDRLQGPSRYRLALIGAGQIAVGIVLIVGGTAALAADAMLLRVATALIGVVVTSRGIGSAARAAMGRPVDLPFGAAVTWMVLLGGAAVLAPVLPLGNYADTAKSIATPGYLRPDLGSAHPLGTNQFGLDMLARVVWGARDSLIASVAAVAIGTVIGGIVGVVAGYFSGWTDRAVGVATNVGLAFPPLVLLLAVAAVLHGSVPGLTLALVVLVVPSTIRVARANALTFAQREYAFAARILGATRWQVLFREVLPNVIPPLAGLALLTIPLLILAEASLSFLGLGIRPPQPSWGNMIAEGANGVFENNPHIVLVPGTALFLTVLSLNVIGQRARRKWDPRQSKL